MIPLALGLATLAALLTVASAFSRASVGTIRAMLAWVAALAGLSLMVLLFLTGRGALAFSGVLLLGPLAWRYWQSHAVPTIVSGAPMGRKEAYAVLGLEPGASDSDVRAAWMRLMRVVHPDGGGSDWLASRVNQAKDVLLRR